MSYMHITNLYKDQSILMFKECWALEKIHGTSAHVSWDHGKLGFFAGGAKPAAFEELFDKDILTVCFTKLGHDKVIVYGEAYGGSMQGMKATYGDQLKFIAFDVSLPHEADEQRDRWLNVEQAAAMAATLGLDFVPYRKVKCELVDLDMARAEPSEVAARAGRPGLRREGVVLRPLEEFRNKYDERVIVKHKNDEFIETKKPVPVVDPAKQQLLTAADAVATQWVTDERLRHVLDGILKRGIGVADPHSWEMSDIPMVVAAMTEDVLREGVGFEDNKENRKAIGNRARQLFMALVKKGGGG